MANNYSSIAYETFKDGDITVAETYYDIMDTTMAFEKILNGINPKHVNFNLHFGDVYGEGLAPSFATLKGYARRNSIDVANPDIDRVAACKAVLKKYHKIRHRHFREIVTDFRRVLAGIEKYCEKKGIDLSSVPSVEDYKEM